jgi:hypothetical protein
MRSLPLAVVLAAGWTALALPGPAGAVPAADVAAGIRQVQEGDFEGAVATLDAAARDLSGRPERKADLVQAYVYLGVALVALEQPDRARRSFDQALVEDPKLRLSPQTFSPKVVAAFEEARRAVRPGKGAGARGWILGGAAAGAAAAAVIAVSGGESEPPPFRNARMATPVIECPEGSADLPITFGVSVDAHNSGGTALTIDSVTVVATIVASPAIPEEVGTASNRPATAIPAAVPPGADAGVRVDSTLLCGNAGGPNRFNEWSVRVTLATSAGVFSLESADRLHVNIP